MDLIDAIAECLNADADTDESAGGTGVIALAERLSSEQLRVITTDGRYFSLTIKESA